MILAAPETLATPAPTGTASTVNLGADWPRSISRAIQATDELLLPEAGARTSLDFLILLLPEVTCSDLDATHNHESAEEGGEGDSMLPDFVKVREPINETITVVLRQLVYQRPLIASIRSERFYEGNTWGAFGEDVADETHEFRMFKTPASIPTQELIDRGPAAVAARLPELAGGMADQIERRMIERMKQAASEETGGEIGTAGNVTTVDDVLAHLERMKVAFDRDGNPIMPMMIVPPSMAAKLQEWDADPDVTRRLAELLARKREEFDARESNRTLAD